METISQLNSKIWYRLLKVMYVVMFLLIIISSVWIAFEENKPYQSDEYLISCNEGNRKNFMARDEGILFLPSLGENKEISFIPSYTDSEIKSECEIYPSFGYVPVAERTYSPPPYSVSYAPLSHGSYLEAFGIAALAFVVVLFVFEFIRRAFYYIVLGKVYPQRRA
jgi:hypothetical protein